MGHHDDTGPGRLVVAGVDGSPSSREALRWACAEAELTGGQVRAVTVRQHSELLPGTAFGLPPRRSAAGAAPEADLHREVALVGTTAPVREKLVVGDPVTELVAACSDADLLVVGRDSHGPLGGALLGGVAAGCVRYAPCPVVLLSASPTR